MTRRVFRWVLGLPLAGLLSVVAPAAVRAETAARTATPAEEEGETHHDEGHGHSSRLSDEATGLQLDGFPERPKPILELGPNYLGTGTLPKGLRLPTGAVWQPALLLFGQLRTAVQSHDSGSSRVAEAAARLDLFANLQLSGTERLVLGFRPFDQNGAFTGYVFDSSRPGVEEGWNDEINAKVTSLFFEGDFGEIFPNLSRRDFSRTDYGFSLGRQPLIFQEGILINDSIDALGITRNTLLPKNTSNFRATLLLGIDNIHRTNRDASRANVEDDSAQLLGLLTSTDFRRSTMDIDAAYLFSDDPTRGDLANLGINAVQRLGQVNTSFYVAASFAPDEETAWSTNGTLLFSEVSWTPMRTHDLAYVNAFVAIDDFSSVARDPATGGPLGRAGVSFAAVGLGNFGSPLSNQAREVYGGAVGYQMFFADTRRQLILELGGRFGMVDDVRNEWAATARYQTALKRRLVVVVDAFAGRLEGLGGSPSETSFGGRLELVTKF